MNYYGTIILIVFFACCALAADCTERTSPVVVAGSFLDLIFGPSSPAENKAEGEAFLAANKNKQGVISLPSGLQYRIIKEGTGPIPKATDNVAVHYRGMLINGTEFDSSYARNEPAVFPVNGVIAGWREALQLMPVGSNWELFLPAKLAYGTSGVGSTIGPNAVLIFQIELLSIK